MQMLEKLRGQECAQDAADKLKRTHGKTLLSQASTALTADILQCEEVSRTTAEEAAAIVEATRKTTAARVAIAGRVVTAAGKEDAFRELSSQWVAGGYGSSKEFFTTVKQMSAAQMQDHKDNTATSACGLRMIGN